MNPKEKLQKARSLLILDHPFFGCLALRLALEENEQVQTATVNEFKMVYNPNFVQLLTTAETVGLLAHEVMHVALGHMWRQDNREPSRWNMACDYTINEELVATGFILPPGGLFDSNLSKLSAEEIYNLIPPLSKEQQQKQDPGGCGGVSSQKGKNQQKINQEKAEWQAVISQAIQINKGELSANVQREIQKILDPPLPWYVLLRDFVEKTARNDYNWSRPSRRYFSRGIILPSLISEELPEIIIAIDTSGSITKEQLSRFAEEISGVFAAYDTKMKILFCDSQIKKEQNFTRADLPLTLEPMGGGGTDFRPVFELANINPPTCLIYFTDLEGDFPKQSPEYPILWITTSKTKTAPFGATIRFEDF